MRGFLALAVFLLQNLNIDSTNGNNHLLPTKRKTLTPVTGQQIHALSEKTIHTYSGAGDSLFEAHAYTAGPTYTKRDATSVPSYRDTDATQQQIIRP